MCFVLLFSRNQCARVKTHAGAFVISAHAFGVHSTCVYYCYVFLVISFIFRVNDDDDDDDNSSSKDEENDEDDEELTLSYFSFD